MKLNINEIRNLAGLDPMPKQMVVESHDEDDDGLSASERALASKADADLKKKGVKVPNVDPDKDMARLANSAAYKRSDASAIEKEEATNQKVVKKPDAEVEKKATSAPAVKPALKDVDAQAEAKRRGKAPNPEGKSGRAREWFKNHASPTRAEFIKYAADSLGMGKHYASAYYQTMKGKKVVTEMYLLFHPSAKNFILAENREMNQYQWTDGTAENLIPVVFETEAETIKLVQYMADIKNQHPRVELYNVDAE